MNSLFKAYTNTSLILRIIIGIALGATLALLSPSTANSLSFLGGLFVSALKAVAPVLIFILVWSALANQKANNGSNSGNGISRIVVLYLLGTFSATLVAVSLSFTFPAELSLVAGELNRPAPQGIIEVLNTLLFKIADNPINALLTANYMSILAWGIGLGLMMRNANDTSKQMLQDLSTGVTGIVRFIIQLAPIGIFGLVAGTFATTGFSELGNYAHILMLLVGAMLSVALVINPLIVYIYTRNNPYPLVFTALRESGITAFFTRSSAANVPVNMQLCKKLRLDENIYSVSIPLGATINMAGAAITITVMTLAAVNTLGIPIDLSSALLLCFIAAIGAGGSSGVAGGSLLLIPLACSLFNIPNDLAMQVVGVGFIIGVIQDSAETALNSSTDVVFTAAVSNTSEATSD